MTHRPSLRVVLVGFGPVGARFAEELLPSVAAGEVALTVVGAERCDPYNRVMVAEYAVGEAERDELELVDSESLTVAGAVIRTGEHVVAIDSAERCVRLDDGSTVPYDRLVLATGARSRVPVLDGLEHTSPSFAGHDGGLTAGVCALRTVDDAQRVREVVEGGGRVVVLGAGVLGIELGMLLAKAGASPSIAHFGPIPMPRQLDRASAAILAAALEAAGLHVIPHTRAEVIVVRVDEDGERRFHALVSSDGRVTEGDLLVLSCGVGARTELATDAGLRVGAGILVDDRLRTWTDPSIHAIGDCAQIADPALHLHDPSVPGGPSGLIGPGWRQAEWLAQSLLSELRGEAIGACEEELPGVVLLKADGVDLISAGDVSAEPFTPVPRGEVAPGVAVWADPEHGTYTKMVTREGVLTGFVSVGMPRTAAELSVLYTRRAELPADRSLLLRLDAADDAAPRLTGRDAPVCMCNAVAAGTIEDAIADGCVTVGEVGACTRAGTGCGGCRARISDMIAASAREVAPT
ncbi:FAD-dependent oxidoreductase [Microbacterium pumilum]|uniref:FAD-dependent oxidoreductase n=1 Tax=Microbacterium pumilum TaxID=344165 RepID=A0ABP5E908_9MICO